MNPILAFLLTEIVKYIPTLAIELVKILSRAGITEADWQVLEAKYRGKTYESYDPPGVVPPP